MQKEAQSHIFASSIMKLKFVSSLFSFLQKGTLVPHMQITTDIIISKDKFFLIQLNIDA